MSNEVKSRDTCKHSEFCSNPYPCTDYCLAFTPKITQDKKDRVLKEFSSHVANLVKNSQLPQDLYGEQVKDTLTNYLEYHLNSISTFKDSFNNDPDITFEEYKTILTEHLVFMKVQQ